MEDSWREVKGEREGSVPLYEFLSHKKEEEWHYRYAQWEGYSHFMVKARGHPESFALQGTLY